MLYSNKIAKLIEKVPAKFVPAVNTHLNNIEKYSSSLSMLLKGLYEGFPQVARTNEPPPLTIINGKKNTAGGKVKKVYRKSASLNNNSPPIVKKNNEKIKIHQLLLSQADVPTKNNNSQRDDAILKHPEESSLKQIWDLTSSVAEIHHNRNFQCHLPVLEGNFDFLETQLQVCY